MRSPRTATKSSPRLTQLEKARAQLQRPNTAKKKKKERKKLKNGQEKKREKTAFKEAAATLAVNFQQQTMEAR